MEERRRAQGSPESRGIAVIGKQNYFLLNQLRCSDERRRMALLPCAVKLLVISVLYFRPNWKVMEEPSANPMVKT